MLFEDEEEDDLVEEQEQTGAPAGGLLPPRETAECLGYENIEKEFTALFNSGRLPHAMIFSGPEGIGKSTMAFRLARFLLKYGRIEEDAGGGLFGGALPAAKPESLSVGPDDNVFRQAASGGHPDLLTIERPFDEKKGRLKDEIPVEEARRVTPFLRMTAAMGGWRVVVVDDADTMNRNGQNAILKILEEPPSNTLLILVAHRAGALLPTIRSRCRVLTFMPPDKDIFAQLLRRAQGDLDNRDIDTLHAMAGGSSGRALRLLREGGIETVGRVAALLSAWPRWNWPEIHAQADILSRQGKEDSFQAFQDVFLWVAESILRARVTGAPLPPVLNSEAVSRIAGSFSLAEWIGICENLKTHFNTVDHANLDKRQAVLGAFMMFEKKQAA